MSIRTVLIAATTTAIALGSLGFAANDASAAVMMKKPGHHHHALACKVGFAPHRVRVHGKWRVECVRVHHHHHKAVHYKK